MKFFDSFTPANVITVMVLAGSIIMGYTQLKDEVRFINKDVARIELQSQKNEDRIHAIELNVTSILTQLKEIDRKIDKLLENK